MKADYSPDLNITIDSSSSKESSKEPKDHPKKKRKSTVRACDACAIRKVKCEIQRPCHHCIANGLKCTQLRERKKSGPKNLHQKTLASINSLSERQKMGQVGQVGQKMDQQMDQQVVEANQKMVEANQKFNANYDQTYDTTSYENNHNNNLELSLIASKHLDHPIEMVPDSILQSNHHNLNNASLIEILNLVNEPHINAILKEYTVHHMTDNASNLIDFVRTIPNAPLEAIGNSNDPAYLSKIVVILSLDLLIVENIIKLVSLNLNIDYSFISHPINYYQVLKKVLLFKIVDITAFIDKILLYPGQNRTNLYLIFYNISVMCVHLFWYFDLSTRYNNNNHNDNKEEIDYEDSLELYLNHQKVYHLRKSISYYHLIDLKNEFIMNKNDLTNYQLNELFEKLFILERLNYLLTPDIIVSVNLLDLNLNINARDPGFKAFKLINNDALILNNLKSFKVLTNLNKYYKINHYPDTNNLLTPKYMSLKTNIVNINKENLFVSILSQVIVFKILMIYSNNLQLSTLKGELIGIVKALNSLIKFDNILYFQFANYKLVAQFLQILKMNIDFENNTKYYQDMIIFTKIIYQFFPSLTNIDKLINSNIVIYEWFEEMKRLTGEVALPVQTQTQTQTHAQPQPSRPSSGYGFKQVQTFSGNSSRSQTPKMLPPSGNQVSNHLPSHPTTSQPIPQLHYQLNKLQESQISLQHSNTSSFESNKDRSEINELLHDFGNSNLSSNSSTNANSIVVTSNPTPEPRSNTPLASKSGTNNSVLQNSNSTSYSTIIQSSIPAPPVITPATATNKPDGENLNVSESTKNLYNLFTQINDDVGPSNSLTNLFQFNNLPSSTNMNSSVGGSVSGGINGIGGSYGSTMNLNKISSLSNFRSSNNAISSTFNLFMKNNDEIDEEEEDDKVKKKLKDQFLL